MMQVLLARSEGVSTKDRTHSESLSVWQMDRLSDHVLLAQRALEQFTGHQTARWGFFWGQSQFTVVEGRNLASGDVGPSK